MIYVGVNLLTMSLIERSELCMAVNLPSIFELAAFKSSGNKLYTFINRRLSICEQFWILTNSTHLSLLLFLSNIVV